MGHTSGRPHEFEEQCAIAEAALSAFEEIDQSGGIIRLPFEWAEDEGWKDSVMQVNADNPAATSDFRLERFETPQYQRSSDSEVADENCPTCVFLEANP